MHVKNEKSAVMKRVPRRPKKRLSGSDEKLSLASAGKDNVDVAYVKEVEALEDRILHDEATEDEYRVGEAYEVALKVSIYPYDEGLHLTRSLRRSYLPETTPSSPRSPSELSSSVWASQPSARERPSLPLSSARAHMILQCLGSDLLLQAPDLERVGSVLARLVVLVRQCHAHCAALQGCVQVAEPRSLQQ